MSIKDLTITDQNVQSTYVQSQPDRLTGTAQQNKAVFDALPQLIIQRFNLLLEALAGTEAAGEIPVEPIEGVTAENVQQALEAIQQNLAAYITKIKAATGAAEVGVSQISGMQAENVQKALEELRTAIDNIVSGIIPGGSITANMLADDVNKILNDKLGVFNGQYTDLSAMPERPLIYLSPASGVVGLPNKWPQSRHNFVRFWCGNLSYTMDFIASYSKRKLAYRFAQGEWDEIATTKPPQVRNLALQSGFTANGDCTFFVMQESVVSLAGGVSGTLRANQDTQIGTLPADAWPDAKRRRAAVTDVGTAYIEVRTDGTVWAHPFATASQCWFDTSFVAGGGT